MMIRKLDPEIYPKINALSLQAFSPSKYEEQLFVKHNRSAGLGHRIVGVRICSFVFHRFPQSFNKNIVPLGSTAIHAEPAPLVLDSLYKLIGNELPALIGADYLGDPTHKPAAGRRRRNREFPKRKN